MYKIFTAYFLVAVITLVSCGRRKILDGKFVDSLLYSHKLPDVVLENNAEMNFWKQRIDPGNPQYINESRYAATLLMRFKQFGEIYDVKSADSIYLGIHNNYHHRLSEVFAALASTAILQHRFTQAGLYLDSAKTLGMDSYRYNNLAFDVNFELGRYHAAAFNLKNLKPYKDYNYYFRRSKYDHYTGQTDSALSSIEKASYLARSKYLKGIALSIQADLYTHQGDLINATASYKKSIRINSTDFHSIMGLGWVALLHDADAKQAKRLFRLVMERSKLPDPIFKFYQVAQATGDTISERRFAKTFAARAADQKYGQMYNKYLIELYTGILNDPAKAVGIARAELKNRATPQTFAWLAYALVCNGKKEEAAAIYSRYISGRPLEALELYYAGQILLAQGKGFDAAQYFGAADRNGYDLSPRIRRFLKERP